MLWSFPPRENFISSRLSLLFSIDFDCSPSSLWYRAAHSPHCRPMVLWSFPPKENFISSRYTPILHYGAWVVKLFFKHHRGDSSRNSLICKAVLWTSDKGEGTSWFVKLFCEHHTREGGTAWFVKVFCEHQTRGGHSLICKAVLWHQTKEGAQLDL